MDNDKKEIYDGNCAKNCGIYTATMDICGYVNQTTQAMSASRKEKFISTCEISCGTAGRCHAENA